MSLLMDPMRLERIAGAADRAYEADSVVGAIVARAALTLDADHASFTLLGVDSATSFSYGVIDPSTLPVLSSYCKFTATGEPFRVDNAKRHPLVCTMEATTTFNIGSYLGVPVTFAGYVLGALCVWNTEPRQWTAKDQSWLTSLAAELTEWWKS